MGAPQMAERHAQVPEHVTLHDGRAHANRRTSTAARAHVALCTAATATTATTAAASRRCCCAPLASRRLHSIAATCTLLLGRLLLLV
jgi:hypothetical protein